MAFGPGEDYILSGVVEAAARTGACAAALEPEPHHAFLTRDFPAGRHLQRMEPVRLLLLSPSANLWREDSTELGGRRGFYGASRSSGYAHGPLYRQWDSLPEGVTIDGGRGVGSEIHTGAGSERFHLDLPCGRQMEYKTDAGAIGCGGCDGAGKRQAIQYTMHPVFVMLELLFNDKSSQLWFLGTACGLRTSGEATGKS